MKRLKKRILVITTILVFLLSFFNVYAAPDKGNNIDLSAFSEDAKAEVVSMMKNADSISVEYLKDKNGNKAKDKLKINIEKTIETKNTKGITQEEKTTISILSTINSSHSASNGKYDIASIVTLYWTLWYDDNDPYGTMSIKLNTITGRINDAGSNPIVCNTFAFAGVVWDSSGFYRAYQNTRTVSSPTSGVTYSKTLNSSYFLISSYGDIGLEYELIFSDNSSLISGWYITG